MGHGGYSITGTLDSNDVPVTNCFVRSSGAYATLTNSEIFTQREITNAMSPKNVEVRESRDSAEHPNSLALILGLDVTGSMGSVPNFLIKEGFNAIMEKIITGGEIDPQILFLGIGDHECDRSPLQVGQFESNDELLHKWLTDVYLEGGGGGNTGESYLLAWFFAAFKTSTDCFEKRGRKGLLFTVGDEPTLNYLPKETLLNLFGNGQYENFTAAQVLEKAREKYEVYHIHVTETSTGKRPGVVDGLKNLLGDSLLVVEHSKDIAALIAQTVLKHKQEGKANVSVEAVEVIL